MEMYMSLQNTYASAMHVCGAACKMLMFNVEDILALPQLKDGKFTKNIQEVGLGTSVREIIDI